MKDFPTWLACMFAGIITGSIMNMSMALSSINKAVQQQCAPQPQTEKTKK